MDDVIIMPCHNSYPCYGPFNQNSNGTQIVRPWRSFSRAYYHCTPERKTMVTKQVFTGNANSRLKWPLQAREDKDLTPKLETETNNRHIENQTSVG